MPLLRFRALVVGTGLLAACGGGTSTEPGTPTAPSFPAIRTFLTIDPANLPAMVSPAWPAHYSPTIRAALDNQPTDQPVTDAMAALGRVLFHDRELSTTRTVACASCHVAATGFSDSARFSVGVAAPARTPMHAMRLGNARFGRSGFFWDRRAPTLEAQTLDPVQNALEHGFDAAAGGLGAVQARMRALPYYAELFRLAYGDTVITTDRMERALATYVRAHVSVRSRWDDGVAQITDPAAPGPNFGAPVPGLTVQENRGKDLFLRPPQQGGAGCAGCHVPPTFALSPNSRSNGLDAGETRIFKSPSLKNVAVGGPFMHDGRFATLEQVVGFYVSGIQDGPALDNRLRPGGVPQRLPLTAEDQAALVAFLRTLTDTQLLTDARFASPFRR